MRADFSLEIVEAREQYFRSVKKTKNKKNPTQTKPKTKKTPQKTKNLSNQNSYLVKLSSENESEIETLLDKGKLR